MPSNTPFIRGRDTRSMYSKLFTASRTLSISSLSLWPHRDMSTSSMLSLLVTSLLPHSLSLPLSRWDTESVCVMGMLETDRWDKSPFPLLCARLLLDAMTAPMPLSISPSISPSSVSNLDAFSSCRSLSSVALCLHLLLCFSAAITRAAQDRVRSHRNVLSFFVFATSPLS